MEKRLDFKDAFIYYIFQTKHSFAVYDKESSKAYFSIKYSVSNDREEIRTE